MKTKTEQVKRPGQKAKKNVKRKSLGNEKEHTMTSNPEIRIGV